MPDNLQRFIDVIAQNKTEVQNCVKAAPDWQLAVASFDNLFQHMCNTEDPLWGESFIAGLHNTYIEAREKDSGCTNITLRTLAYLPEHQVENVKTVFLQIASTCRIFNQSHKVNFEPAEVPVRQGDIPLVQAKKRGYLTFKNAMPALYANTSLTFDYWIPKILSWTLEVRHQKASDWRGDAALSFESCTDFMRIALQFLSSPQTSLPVAKQDLRIKLIENVMGQTFNWEKKSQKRESIACNNRIIQQYLQDISTKSEMDIPIDAWNRILALPAVRQIFK